MIKSIKLKNFQSHENTEINFCEGLNVILGNSRSGKTAIMRSLIWNRYDKPQGNAFVSFWDRDSKKMPKTEHVSEIVFDDCTIKRIKTKKRNGYDVIINGELKEYNAIGKVGVPEDIINLFNMNEVNIQKQIDMPFMIGETSSEVAKFLNRIINLEIIDKILIDVESRRIKAMREQKSIDEEIPQLEKKLKSLDWIDEAEDLYNMIQRRQEQIEVLYDRGNELESILMEIESIEKTLDKYNNIDEAAKIVELIDEQASIIESKKEHLNKLNDLQLRIAEANDANKYPSIEKCDEALSIIESINKLDDFIFQKNKASDCLLLLYNDIQKQEIEIKNLKRTLIELEDEMPDICPTCGREL
ncbi:MAG: AAA family ATPase [Candidatus Thorarchaeota archaeon]